MVALRLVVRMALVPGFLAVVSLLGPVVAVADAASTQSTTLGEFEYRNFCASCHGVTGNGDGPLATMLKVAPNNLTTISQGNGGVFPRERLRDFIDGRTEVASHGNRDMPVWGDWFRQETLHDALFLSENVRELSVKARIAGLLVYIESLQFK